MKMRLSKNQAGFSVVELLLVILVVAVLGFIGWFVWHSSQDKSPVSQATSSDTSTTKSNTTSTNTGEDNKVLAAAYAYCATLNRDGKTYTFYLSTSKTNPNKGVPVVYSDNNTKAVVDGSCYDTSTEPQSSAGYPFIKAADGTWSLDTSVDPTS
jgi:type II secretory pathway pseudopilin PulG